MEKKIDINIGDAPGGPVAKTSPSSVEGECSIPGQGGKIPQAAWYSQKKRKKT